MLVEASVVGRASAIPEAFLFGILLGMLYDVFRILRTALGLRNTGKTGNDRLSAWTERRRKETRKRILPEREKSYEQRKKHSGDMILFVLDLLFSLLCGVGMAVFLYWRSDGIVRWYLLLSVLAGFSACYFTVGVCVMRVSDAVTAGLRALCIRIYDHTLYYVLLLLFRLFRTKFRAGRGMLLRILASAAARRFARADKQARKRSAELLSEAENAAAEFARAVFEERYETIKERTPHGRNSGSKESG